MATDVATDVVKFHLSLNSSNLMKSIAFYRTLFGVEPAKVRADYARFEIAEPPVILSLAPVAPTPGGTMNHVGVRVLDSGTLVDMQARLEQAGYATQREEGVECCYSKQTKFWVTDPDRTLWELYILHGEADEDHGPTAEHGVAGNTSWRAESGSDRSLPQQVTLPVLQPTAPPQQSVVWAHMLTQPLPERISHDAATVDEVQLHGTLNMAVDRAALVAFFAETLRVLRPGGTLYAHVLTSNDKTVDKPGLPGPAALVDRVLPLADVMRLIEEGGFVGVRLTKLGEKPCFTAAGSEFRETKIHAEKSAAACCDESAAQVVYKGPLRSVTDESGTKYLRGVPTTVTAAAWESLRAAGLGEQFVRFGGDAKTGRCCG